MVLIRMRMRITDECDDVFFTTENAITGSGNDILSADYLNNQSDNEFTGGAGNDQMEGGAGNDTFHEGSAANGADAMEGDAGADVADYSQRTNPVPFRWMGTRMMVRPVRATTWVLACSAPASPAPARSASAPRTQIPTSPVQGGGPVRPVRFPGSV